MAKPRRKPSQCSDNLTQTCLDSFFKTTKANLASQASQPVPTNKENVRKVGPKKPVPKTKSTPVKLGVMTITKSTPLSTTVEKLKPRLLQRKQINSSTKTNKSTSRNLFATDKGETSKSFNNACKLRDSNQDDDDSDVEFIGEIVGNTLIKPSPTKLNGKKININKRSTVVIGEPINNVSTSSHLFGSETGDLSENSSGSGDVETNVRTKKQDLIKSTKINGSLFGACDSELRKSRVEVLIEPTINEMLTGSTGNQMLNELTEEMLMEPTSELLRESTTHQITGSDPNEISREDEDSDIENIGEIVDVNVVKQSRVVGKHSTPNYLTHKTSTCDILKSISPENRRSLDEQPTSSKKLESPIITANCILNESNNLDQDSDFELISETRDGNSPKSNKFSKKQSTKKDPSSKFGLLKSPHVEKRRCSSDEQPTTPPKKLKSPKQVAILSPHKSKKLKIPTIANHILCESNSLDTKVIENPNNSSPTTIPIDNSMSLYIVKRRSSVDDPPTTPPKKLKSPKQIGMLSPRKSPNKYLLRLKKSSTSSQRSDHNDTTTVDHDEESDCNPEQVIVLSPQTSPNRSLLRLQKPSISTQEFDHNNTSFNSDTTIIVDHDEDNLELGYKVKPKISNSPNINLEEYGIKLDELLDDNSMNETKNEIPTIRVRSFANEPSSWNLPSTSTSDHNEFRFSEPAKQDDNNLNVSSRSLFTELYDSEGNMRELRRIMKFVASCPNLYSMLFDKEKASLQQFFEMPNDYQLVCFKLFTRLSKWYNMVQFVADIKLEMSEEEILEMFKELEEKHFVFTDYTKDPAVNLLSNLGRKEVKSIFDSFKLRPGKKTKKDDLIAAILSNCNKQTTLTVGKGLDAILLDRIQEKMGSCVKLDYTFHNSLFRIHLLYSFSNPDFLKPVDLYWFMSRVQRGEIILPRYTTDFTPIFTTREEFLRFSLASEMQNEYILAKEKKNTDYDTMQEIIQDAYVKLKEIVAARYADSANKPSFLKKFTAGHVYAKTLSLACKDFTKRTELVIEWLEFLLLQDQYLVKRRGQWYNQLAMAHDIYFHDTTQAAYVVAEGLCDPKVSIVDQHELSMRARGLIKRKNNPIPEECEELLTALLLTPPDAEHFPESVINANAIMLPATNTKRMYIRRNSTGITHISVEQVVLDHYANLNFPKGIHCEGSLITTIFFILFWDIIYDFYVPSTFLSEIQAVPLDIRSRDFYTNRKVQIDERLHDIQSDWSLIELEGRILDNAQLYVGNYSPASSEWLGNPMMIVEAVNCLGREPLCRILRRLVGDFGTFHAGMPDLFVWNNTNKTCRFIEVKGEGDKLSMKQKLWLEFLRSAGCDVEVSLVNTIGSKVKRRARK